MWLLALIWGFSFLLVKIGERALDPTALTFGRVSIGAVTLGAIVAAGGDRLPCAPATWAHLAVTGLLMNALPFTLIALGEQHVSSVLAGIWNATTPLFTVPVALVLIPDERLSRQRVAGLGVGFAGVLTVLGIWRAGGTSSLAGSLMCLGAAGCYGVGFPYSRRFLTAGTDGPLALAAGQLICATAELALVVPVLAHVPHSLSADVLGSVLALGALGTGIAYVLSFSIVRDAGATAAATVTYIIPVFSTLAGILLLREPLGWYQPVGAAVILAGAATAQGRLRLSGRSRMALALTPRRRW